MRVTAMELTCLTLISCTLITYQERRVTRKDTNKKEKEDKDYEIKIFDYCDLDCNGTAHTMCKFPAGGGPRCNNNLKVYLNKAEKKYILDIMNQVRFLVANGDEGLPEASNMMKLVWDSELSTIAKRWADQCTQPKHDKCRITQGEVETGQNVYMGKYSKRSYPKISEIKMARVKEALEVWKSERELFDPAWLKSYNSSTEEMSGNFTQMIWGTTQFVGCGYTEFEKGHYITSRFICNFRKKGNDPLHKVYREGEPCSKCPSRSVCSETYKGMCWNKETSNFKDLPEDDGSHLKSPFVHLIILLTILLVIL